MSVVSRTGLVGLLTPSGIASDKTASRFFQSIATAGRLAALYDFKNRKVFFPDVHASFKFCTLIAKGRDRDDGAARCAFLLHDVTELSNEDKVFDMTAADFANVNPNTGTAPIFRSKRDAEITKAIYSRLPVLVDRSGADVRAAYPVRYSTMFHMTNDAHLFVTKAELDTEGYPTGGNRYRKDQEEYVPLYVGRMVHQFDHRAASVEVNAANIHNAALSADITEAEKADPGFTPTPQYWVPVSALHWPAGATAVIAFRDIARSTDARTMIAGAIPVSGAGNTLPLVLPESGDADYGD